MTHGSRTITLSAKSAGTATITVAATDLSDTTSFEKLEDGGKIIKKSITIKVNDPAPVNEGKDTSGANLKSITVAGKTYNNPATDFTVTVGSDVNAVEVKAIANDGNAKISGTGAKDLVTGTNVVTITVTASNGATKKYTVRIRKLAETKTTPNVIDNTPKNNNSNEEEPEDDVLEIEDLRLTYLRIEDVELIPEFNSEIFEYKVEVTNIDKIDIVAVQNIEGAEVEISGNSDLKEGENEILITISKEGQESVVYRILVTKTIEEIVQVVPEEENSDIGGFLSTTGGKLAVSVGGAATVGILIFIVYKIKAGAEITTNTARRAAVRRSTFNDFDD